MSSQSGKVTFGFILFILCFAAALDASFQLVPIYMSYLDFKNEIESRAMEPQQPNPETDERIRKVLMNKALEFNIPLDPEKLKIEFGDHTTHITASWSSNARFLGGHYTRRIPFVVDANKANYRS